MRNPAPGGGLSGGLPLAVSLVLTPPASALSRAALDDYLSHSLVMQTWALNEPQLGGDTLRQHQDNLRMVANVGAKHVQWAAGFFWSKNSNFDVDGIMRAAAQVAEDLHAQDPGIIVGAGIYETTSPLVDQIAIPGWVFEEFNQPVTVRNFDWSRMAYSDQRPSDGNPDTPAIDITQLEARGTSIGRGATSISATKTCTSARCTPSPRTTSPTIAVTGRSFSAFAGTPRRVAAAA